MTTNQTRTESDRVLAAMAERKVQLSIQQANGSRIDGDALCREHAEAKLQMSRRQGQRG